MVQINEIRYKNYFETVKHGSIIQISGFRTYSTDKPLVRYENHGGEYGLDQIKPIKLTEEWLLKAGYKKQNGYGYSNYNIYGTILKNETGFEFHYYGIIIRLDFVHQLQNLFFSLYCEDLVFSTEP